MDEELLISFLVVESDISTDEIIAAKKHDEAIILTLVSYAVQLPLGLRWCEPLWKREVAWRMLKDRAAHCGHRLQKLKANRCLRADGAVIWKDASHTCIFSDEGRKRLVRVTHNSSKKGVEVPASVNYFRGLVSITDNHSDIEAVLLQPPNPPMKLSSLFESGEGPWAYVVVEKMCKVWKDYIPGIEAQYEQEMKQTQSAASCAGDAADKLHQFEKGKVKARCLEARKKVAENSKKKQQDKVIKLS